MTSTHPEDTRTDPPVLEAVPIPRPRRHPIAALARCLVGTCLLAWIASPLVATDRFYVDLQLGRADFDRGFGELHPWVFDDHAASPSVALGVDLHPNLALEVGFQAADDLDGLGSPCYPSPESLCIAAIGAVEADLELWTFAVVPKKRFGRFTVFGRLGVAYYEQDMTVKSPFPGSLGRWTDTELLLGAGARLDLTPRLELLMNYDRIEVGLQTLGLGLGYRF